MMSIPDTTVCEQCGGQIELRQEGSTHGLYCTRCDWSIVTTHIPEITLDTTSYEVRVDGDCRNEGHVKAAAEVSGMNFLAARKLLQEPRSIVFTGRAVDVMRAREILTAAGMGCTINPDFRW
jgi:hypothetical protein